MATESKQVTVRKFRRGRASDFTGTVEELVGSTFGHTLSSAASYDSKFNARPTTAKALVRALNRAASILQSGSFNPNSYELVEG